MRGAVVLFSRRRRSIIALTHSRRAARTPDRPNPIGIHRVIVTPVEPAKVHVAALEASDGSKVAPSARPYCRPSGVGKTRRVGLSGAVASLVVAVPRVTRQVTGRRVRAFGMNCPRVRGGAGLAPAAGLIRSLSAFSA